MRTFYYVHTGHRTGLDRFRRAVAIINSLGDVDITLLCSDYRIAQACRDFGIEKSVGIDVVRNIPQIAQNGDQLIFDSEEANPIMLEDMREFFSAFIRVSDLVDDTKANNEFLISPYLEGENICNAYAIADTYFQKSEKTIELSYFFGDDDYEKDLQTHLEFLDGLNPDLQLGFYYFLEYEDLLKNKFVNHHEFEEYEEMIKSSKILITASPQAVLESLASGGKPIYIQREDYTKNFHKLFETLNIPIVTDYDKNQLKLTMQTISSHKYENSQQFSNKISKFIKENLNL